MLSFDREQASMARNIEKLLSTGILFLSNSALAISGGERIGNINAAYHSTVALKHQNSIFCSGVLIDDRTVITSASCLATIGDAANISVGFGKSEANGVMAQLSVSRSQWMIHEDFDPAKPTNNPKNDIALIVLSEPAGMGFFSTAISEDYFLQPNLAMRVVGFGESMDDPLGSEKLIRETNVLVDRVDSKSSEFSTKSTYTNPRAALNSGDFGGPAFGKLADGTLKTVGVASRAIEQTSLGGARFAYTDLRKFTGWIAQTRQNVLEKMGTTTNRWHDQYLATSSDVYVHLAWQTEQFGDDSYLTNPWVMVTGKKVNEKSDVVVQLSSVFFDICQQKKRAEWSGKEFRAHFTALEGCQINSESRKSETKLEIWVNGIKQLSPLNRLDFFIINLSL